MTNKYVKLIPKQTFGHIIVMLKILTINEFEIHIFLKSSNYI